MKKVKNCKHCGKEFMYAHENSVFCSNDCIIEFRKDKASNNIEGIEGKDYIVCKICGRRVKRIYGRHLKEYHDNMSSFEYKSRFPGAILTCKADKESTSKNSGKHMKQEKYRKMVSDMFTGEGNPNHKSKVDKKTRKERSPFSKEFYNKRGLDEKDRKVFIKEALKDREFETRIDYWIKRGFSEKEARLKVKERQTTFSLEKCIDKYGEEKGLERWKKRQEKWKEKVFNSEQYIGKGSSKVAEKLIKDIIFKNDNQDILLFGKNEKFIYDNLYSRVYKYDLTNKSTNKIIEFNGIFWHCKPGLYESNYFHKIKKLTAKEIWDYDKRKKSIASDYGYKLLIIWEDDYYEDPDRELKKCLDFIYEKDT